MRMFLYSWSSAARLNDGRQLKDARKSVLLLKSTPDITSSHEKELEVLRAELKSLITAHATKDGMGSDNCTITPSSVLT